MEEDTREPLISRQNSKNKVKHLEILIKNLELCNCKTYYL